MCFGREIGKLIFQMGTRSFFAKTLLHPRYPAVILLYIYKNAKAYPSAQMHVSMDLRACLLFVYVFVYMMFVHIRD